MKADFSFANVPENTFSWMKRGAKVMAKKLNLETLPNFCFLAVTFEPQTLDGQSRALKMRIFV